jgi:arylesterase/paraoxonase
MRIIDFALQRLRSDVVYFNGKAARVAAADFGYANGINASPDRVTVYVTDTFTRRLRFFSPNAQTGALTETGSLMLGTGLDNIDVDADGALWIAAHPKLMDLALHTEGWSQQAPSQVIRAVPGAAGGGEVRTVLLDLGERLSAASVAAAFGDRYLVGSLMDSKMLLCRTGGD